MEPLSTDEILKQATAFKRQVGVDKAISFLIFSIKNNDILNNESIRLLSKINTYIKNASSETQKATIELYDNLKSALQKKWQ